MTTRTIGGTAEAVKPEHSAHKFMAGAISAPIRIIRCSTTPVWLALVRTVEGRPPIGGRFLITQKYWSAQQLLATVFPPFESDLDDPQDAKDDCLFNHFALMGNYYPNLRHGDRVEEKHIGEVRTLLADGDHLSAGGYRLLQGTEAWAHHTAHSTTLEPRLRILVPLAEPFTPLQGRRACLALNAVSGGEADLNQFGYPPILFPAGPDTAVRYRQGELMAWADLEPLVPTARAEKYDLKLLDSNRPRLITSPAVRRLYGFLKLPGAVDKVVNSLFKMARGNLGHCPLPGHRNHDAHPSASILTPVGQLPFEKCWMGHGLGHGKLFVNLGELELRRPWPEMPKRPLNPATQLMGWARLLVRSGVVDPLGWTMYRDFHELRAAVTERCERTPRGFSINGVTLSSTSLDRLLAFIVEFTACKRMLGHSTTATTLSPGFIALWLGIDRKEAYLMKDFAKGVGLIQRGRGWVEHRRGRSYGADLDTDEQHLAYLASLSQEADASMDSLRIWEFRYLTDLPPLSSYPNSNGPLIPTQIKDEGGGGGNNGL